MHSRGPESPRPSAGLQDRRSAVLPTPRSTANNGTVAHLLVPVPLLRLRPSTRRRGSRAGHRKSGDARLLGAASTAFDSILKMVKSLGDHYQHRAAHLKGASNEPARGGAMTSGPHLTNSPRVWRPAMSKLRMLSLAAAIVALVAYYSIQFYHLAVEPARAHTTERAR